MMAPEVPIAVTGLLVVVTPWLARRLRARSDARLLASLQLMELVAAAALPATLLACIGAVGLRDPAALCAHPVLSALRWAAWGLGGLYVIRLGSSAWAVVAATRRARAGLLDTTAARLRSVDGHTYLLVASDRPFACAPGGRPRVVALSTGLAARLDRSEREAVLAHERAHHQLGHHRLLATARVLDLALGRWLPQVRAAATELTHELEVLADSEAARAVGDPRVVARALAKGTLAAEPRCGGGPGFGDPDGLAYRLDRLMMRQGARGAVAAGTWLLVLGVALAGAVCAVLGHGLPVGALVCTVTVGWLAVGAVRPGGAPPLRDRA